LTELTPGNDLWINPQPALERGIRSGDLVEVASTVGAVRLPARVTEEIRPDCVFMLHGFGKRSRALRRANAGACDADVLTTAMDRVSGNAAFHETFVTVKKVEVDRA